MKLSVVIPARNEEGNIGTTIAALCEQFAAADVRDFEILVVDDGSSDRTYEVVAALSEQDNRIRVIHNLTRNGYGRAVACGLDNFTGEAVIITMADSSELAAGRGALLSHLARRSRLCLWLALHARLARL